MNLRKIALWLKKRMVFLLMFLLNFVEDFIPRNFDCSWIYVTGMFLITSDSQESLCSLLAFHKLAIYTGWHRFCDNDVKKNLVVSKIRDMVHYILFMEESLGLENSHCHVRAETKICENRQDQYPECQYQWEAITFELIWIYPSAFSMNELQ